jgi:hypothetical protein
VSVPFQLKAMFLAGYGILLFGRTSSQATEVSDGITVVNAKETHALDAISGSETITAVSAKVFNNYSRTKQADGSFKPESYAFGNGGLVRIRLGALQDSTEPTMMRDDTVDDITFAEVVSTIKGPLADKNYLMSHDPEATNLLIMVFWGLTVGGSNFSGPDRDRVDQINASYLGYDSEAIFSELNDLAPRANMMMAIHNDVLSSIEPNRYWVVLRAFDFQSSWKKKKPRLLWETRFSLSQRRHDFGKNLPEMTSVAAQYFGQDTHGLVRKEVPLGRVEFGEMKSLGEVSDKTTTNSAQPSDKNAALPSH